MQEGTPVIPTPRKLRQGDLGREPKACLACKARPCFKSNSRAKGLGGIRGYFTEAE